MASFCPGYAQVDEFGPDEEYEEEEVSYVILDLGRTEPTLLPSSSTYRLIVSPLNTKVLEGNFRVSQHKPFPLNIRTK